MMKMEQQSVKIFFTEITLLLNGNFIMFQQNELCLSGQSAETDFSIIFFSQNFTLLFIKVKCKKMKKLFYQQRYFYRWKRMNKKECNFAFKNRTKSIWKKKKWKVKRTMRRKETKMKWQEKKEFNYIITITLLTHVFLVSLFLYLTLLFSNFSVFFSLHVFSLKYFFFSFLLSLSMKK